MNRHHITRPLVALVVAGLAVLAPAAGAQARGISPITSQVVGPQTVPVLPCGRARYCRHEGVGRPVNR